MSTGTEIRKNPSIYKIVLYAGIFLLVCFSQAEARDNIVLVQTGTHDSALFGGLKKFLATQGYGITTYEAAATIEQQIQNANKINKEKKAILIAVEMVTSSKQEAFIAVSQANKSKGKLPEIDEVQGIHSSDSEVLARSIAEQFNSKVKKLPLFVSLGIDMPAVFLRIDCPKEKTREAYRKLADGLHNHFDRSEKNENERKSE